MIKIGPVVLGFILAVFGKIITEPLGWSYELLALLIVGFIVGLAAKDGAWGGFTNAAVAGGLGGIIIGLIIFIIGLFGIVVVAPLGLITSGIGIFVIIVNFLCYGILMGIAGAIGGMIIGNKEY
ncbi:MAG: DUF5518 domain-containing protein [Methanobrevibacter sp.]|jgi:hypothetical protein|nr:DUF5518 domain-containing protein [Candidatus Methanoflexus mossambicus]